MKSWLVLHDHRLIGVVEAISVETASAMAWYRFKDLGAGLMVRFPRDLSELRQGYAAEVAAILKTRGCNVAGQV